MFKYSYASLACALVAGLGSALYAEEESTTLEELVIIANRVPVPMRKIAVSVAVIEEQKIQAHGNISLTDVIRQSTAVGASSNGGAGSLSSLRIRGEEAYRTLVLFDGIKLSDPSGPQVAAPIEHILSTGVGRVEVLRGPQGLSYGADAGGVISISSRLTQPGFSANIDGQTGARGSSQYAASIAAANTAADFTLSVFDFKTTSYNVRASDTVLADKDGYENTSYHGRLGMNVNENLRVELAHRNVAGETEYDACFAATTVYDCDAIFDQEASRVALVYSSSSFSHSLAYSITETDRDDLALGVSAFDSSGELERWEYVGSASSLPCFDLIYGIDLEQEHNGAGAGSRNRDNEGYYLEYLSDFSDNFFLTAGVRRDDNDDFGDHSSYRISSAYLIDFDASLLKLKASYGTGFRAPSLFELAYNSGPFALPPAASTVLQEESSAGFEIGLEYFAGEQLHLELVVFKQEVEDAIFFDLSGFSGYLQDFGSSTSAGLEIIGAYAISDRLQLSANTTYNETERPNGLQRLRRPRQLTNLGLNYRWGGDRLTLNVFYRISTDAIDEQFGTAVELDDFAVLDITGSYKISDNIQLYARLENATDERYQEVRDFISPDRASCVGIKLYF
jgi:vitamin B12 transporter